MSQITQAALIKCLNADTNIKVLALVNVNLVDSVPNDIAIWLSKNNKLTELDISWNKIKPAKYTSLIEQLSQSREI